MGVVSNSKVEQALRELSDRLALQGKEEEGAERKKTVQKMIGEVCFKFDLSPMEEESLRRSFQQ